jgi:hypothetical protein
MRAKDRETGYLFDISLIKTEPSREEIAAARWTRARLTSWGIPWPPPAGWREKLELAADEREGRILVVAAGHDYERFQYFYYKRGER